MWLTIVKVRDALLLRHRRLSEDAGPDACDTTVAPAAPVLTLQALILLLLGVILLLSRQFPLPLLLFALLPAPYTSCPRLVKLLLAHVLQLLVQFLLAVLLLMLLEPQVLLLLFQVLLGLPKDILLRSLFSCSSPLSAFSAQIAAAGGTTGLAKP